jgi:Tol biopolymer transport system component
VTNDLNDYSDLSLTKDGKTLVAVQSERRANIQLAQSSDTSRTRQLTSTNYDGLGGISWTPDGKLVYTLQAASEQNLWLTDLDGGEPKQLTAHAGLNRQPVVSSDGRFIVFVSNRTGRYHLWRIDADGKHPQELTHGAEDAEPDLSADGQTVIYRSVINGMSHLFRIPLTGGEPVRLTDRTSGLPTISPDGKLIAFFYRQEPAAKNQISIIPINGGEPKLIRDLPSHYGQLHWTPDGSAIAFAARQNEQGNIWIQPLDGSQPKQLTYWRPDPVFSFNWSRDGKWLAYASGTIISDVVLLRDSGR